MADPILDANTPAGSSPATGATGASPTPDDKKTLAQVVAETAAAHAKSQPDPSPEPGEGQPNVTEGDPHETDVPSEQANEPTEETPSETPVEEDFSSLPFNKHPRFQQVIKERNEYKQKAQEVEELRPFAEMGQTLNRYCQENAISEQDLEEALHFAALAKRDPKSFRSKIQELVDGIDFAEGSRLPSDLQAEVDAGTLNEERAKELAQLRERHKIGQQTTQRVQQSAVQQNVQAMSTTLNNWENSQRTNDPDYMLRRDALKDRMHTLWVEHNPRTPREVILLAEQANREVIARYAKLKPKARATAPALKSNGSPTNQGEELKLDSLKDLGKLVNNIASRHRK